MSYIRNTFLVVFSTAMLFLATDFILTALKLDPYTLQKPVKTIIPGRRHDIYHHDLKPNLRDIVTFGTISYELCTNEYGFKISCAQKNEPASKDYDIAFIGDSFTEALGMTYEQSYVGLFATNNPDLRVANLGVGSYTPSIYYAKIAYLLKQGFTFKHIVVAVDVGDIWSEGVLYKLSADGTKVLEKQEVTSAGTAVQPVINEENKPKHNNIFEKYFKYTWYINLIVHEFFFPSEIILAEYEKLPHITDWTHTENPSTYGAGGIEGAVTQAVEVMAKLKKLLDSNGIKMSVVVYPWPAQLMHAPVDHKGVMVWKEFCEREKCANFIDLNPPLYDAMAQTSLKDVIKKYYILGDVHYNKEGNALLYKTIEQNMINK